MTAFPRVAIGVALLAAVLSSTSAPASLDQGERDGDADRISPMAGVDFGQGKVTPAGVAICTTATSNAANVDTGCEPNEIQNETTIAVNPTNAANIIAAANEYQLQFTQSGKVGQVSALPRAHVTFDGGRTWADYPVWSNYGRSLISDPSVAFDANGRAYYALLGSSALGSPEYDVLVATSTDGGRNWNTTQVQSGHVQRHYLDKEIVAAWGDGNAVVTYTDYALAPNGAILGAQIVASVTHDAGRSWGSPVVVSGDSLSAFLATPVVGADGRVYVSYFDGGDSRRGYGELIRVVEVDAATGQRVGGPYDGPALVDAGSDYPVNIVDRATFQDSEFRALALGNMTADPTDAAHLALIWSDMRNSPRPAPADPYDAITNSDVVVSQSYDHGRTWSAPLALGRTGDQFQPCGAYDASGRLRIGMYDRSADPANRRYDYSLASETAPGSLSFSFSTVTTAMSEPTQRDEWFAAAVDPEFLGATRFIGDYSAIAVVPGMSSVVAYWTDLRDEACVDGHCGHGQTGYFAAIP